ncbi:MAG TPA: right-handed parallel beta-helix repeat-containing protein [Mucilaginibacter sp.]|jgi:hypothetical protein|nr:right-handed parallel beta-helix repeat-containing protein [Mucilaginibacter sp.]
MTKSIAMLMLTAVSFCTIKASALQIKQAPAFKKSKAVSNTINIKSSPYFAKGDGITDDSYAIQSAIDAAGRSGAKVVFPKTSGYYVVNKGLVVNKSHVIIMGNGAKIKNRTSAHVQMLAFLGTTNKHITGCGVYRLTIDGNGTVLDINASGIIGSYVERLTIKDCRVLNAWGQGIGVGKSAKVVQILHNYVYNYWGDGIHIGDQNGGEIVANVVVDNNTVKNGYDDGIAVTSGAHNVRFMNNLIDKTSQGAGIDISGGYNVTAANNKVYHYGQIGIRIQAYGGDAYNINVTHNTVGAAPVNQFAINCFAPNLHHPESTINIIGNTVNGNSVGLGAIYLNGTSNVFISNNILNRTRVGISMDGLAASPNKDVRIEGNTFNGHTVAIGVGGSSINPNTIKRRNKYINTADQDDK